MADFLDVKTIFTIVHVFGAVLGFGGAIASDFMFFASIKDRLFTKKELEFLRIGSKMTWIGIFVLVLSGLGLFLFDPATYLSSSKFLTKISIVLIIIINGSFFHVIHIPIMAKTEGVAFVNSQDFMKNKPFMLTSGVVSIVSWSATLILGILRFIPLTYGEAMLIYGGVLIVTITSVLSLKGYLFKSLI